MIQQYEKFSFYINSIYKSFQKIHAEEMHKYGLKGAHAQYLLALYRCEGGATPAKLASLCDNDKAAVSRALSDLIEKGLVKKEGEGIYKATLVLTEAGKSAAEYVFRKAESAVEITGLTDEERNTFYSVLEKIENNLQLMCKNGIN